MLEHLPVVGRLFAFARNLKERLMLTVPFAHAHVVCLAVPNAERGVIAYPPGHSWGHFAIAVSLCVVHRHWLARRLCGGNFFLPANPASRSACLKLKASNSHTVPVCSVQRKALVLVYPAAILCCIAIYGVAFEAEHSLALIAAQSSGSFCLY